MTSATLFGRLTKDLELSYTQGGVAIGKFSVACDRQVKKGENWESQTSYFDCTLFGKRAEGLKQYMTKGRQVTIIGELVQESWQTENGKRYAVKINVQSVGLGSTPNSTQNAYEPREQAGAGYRDEPVPPELFDGDEIPF